MFVQTYVFFHLSFFVVLTNVESNYSSSETERLFFLYVFFSAQSSVDPPCMLFWDIKKTKTTAYLL